MRRSQGRVLGLCFAVALPPLAHCGEADGEMDAGTMMESPDAGGAPGEDLGMPDEAIPEPVLVSIRLSPESVAVNVGASEMLFVTDTFDSGDIMLLEDGVTFASSDGAVATVDPVGLVSGVAAGAATITATVGDLSESVEVTVREAATEDVVFGDVFGPGVVFAPFDGSTNDIAPTTDEAMVGTSSLRIVVPGGGYTGGAFTLEEEGAARDVSGFDAVTFWAKADASRTMNVAGIGNDAVDASLNSEVRGGIPLTTDWAQFTVPLPDPTRLTTSRGLFHFAEGSEDGPYTIFLDEIRYVRLGEEVLTNVRPSIPTEAVSRPVNRTYGIERTTATFAVDGGDVTLDPCARAFFQFASAAAEVATVDGDGVITGVAEGETMITATLAGVDASGAITFTVTPSLSPNVAAPTPPARDAADVVALFSNAYAEVPVDTFRTPWSDARTTLTETTIAGDDVLFYENMLFAGVETTGANQLDVSDMTHVHLDIWVEGVAIPNQVFTIKIIDWGADGVQGGGDDSEGELIFTISGAPSPPALMSGQWQSFDLAFTDFAAGGEVDVGDLRAREHISQIVLKSEIPANQTTNLWVDNFYFYRAP